MRILLTGGLGFIGSHTAVVLVEQGHDVVLLDNLCNSQTSTLKNLAAITGRQIPFYEKDVRDTESVQQILREHHTEAVIHLAGLKSVSESAQDPLKYYENNVNGTISLIGAMQSQTVRKLIFSSSATVYGVSHYLPCDEEHPLAPINPYGKSKLQAEQIMQDLAKSDPLWSIVALRYFNPVGAHESGLIGEVPNGIPNNLMPYICQVASGILPYLNVFGDDYDTKDGTGERDYIHVMDLAEGHAAAIDWLAKNTGFEAINLGTGMPYSVYDLISAFEQAADCVIPKQVKGRREGDLPIYYAKAEKAKAILGWKAKRDLQMMCDSSWNFQSNFQKS